MSLRSRLREWVWAEKIVSCPQEPTLSSLSSRKNTRTKLQGTLVVYFFYCCRFCFRSCCFCLANNWLTMMHSSKLLPKSIIFILPKSIIFIVTYRLPRALQNYLPVVAVSFDNWVWRKMFLVVKTRALLHRYTPLTIMHCAVTTATAVKTSLRTNVISLFYLTRGRARRTTFGVLQSLWARGSCMNKAVF